MYFNSYIFTKQHYALLMLQELLPSSNCITLIKILSFVDEINFEATKYTLILLLCRVLQFQFTPIPRNGY